MKQKLFTCSICTATKSELKRFAPEASVNFPAVEVYFCKFDREPSRSPRVRSFSIVTRCLFLKYHNTRQNYSLFNSWTVPTYSHLCLERQISIVSCCWEFLLNSEMDNCEEHSSDKWCEHGRYEERSDSPIFSA